METEISHDELDGLRQQAQELNAKVQARENELAQARKGFDRLPELAEKLHRQLGACNCERQRLDATLAEFAQYYRMHVLEGGNRLPIYIGVLSAQLLSREMRLEVIAGIEREAKAELSDLEKDNGQFE